MKIVKEHILNINKLEKELEIFRKNQEDYYEWNDDKECFKGTCQSVTEELVEYLTNLGYNACRTGGYYYGADDEYYPNISEWDLDDQEEYSEMYYNNGESSNGLPQKHWWVELENYIIDVTEDQFHSGEEDEYRIGIYKKPDRNYNIKRKKL